MRPPSSWMALAALLAGCAKTVDGGCASDADCPKGVRCDQSTNRCEIEPDAGPGPAVCTGAKTGDDDPACGTIDCDALDDGCRDFTDVTSARCAGDGQCRPPNDPATCTTPADRCFPYTCDESGAEPVCPTRCMQASECAPGLGCPAGRCCDGGWETFTIDATGDVGRWARIVVDSQGNAHAAWLERGLYRVRIGTSQALDLGTWTTSTVPPPDPADSYGGDGMLSLGVDDTGARHLLYLDESTNEAIYGTDAGAGWTTSTLSGFWLGGTMAIAYNGLAHIIVTNFFDNAAYEFRGAMTGVCPGTSPLAMTTNTEGRAHFIYWVGSIDYAAQSASCDVDSPTTTDCCTFDTQMAAIGDPPAGGFSRYAIAYDSEASQAHITHYAGSTADLLHIACGGGGCVGDVIDAAGDVGRYSSIVVGAGGLHVAYYDGTNEHLRYATNAYGVWETFLIDEADGVGQYASLARGSDGRLHAAYYDAGPQDALYATLAPECVPGE